MKSITPKKLSTYLYYMELADYRFSAMPQEASPLFTVGCSSVRRGNLYGRNLDLGYCAVPEFVVRVDSGSGRFASIGVCADLTAPWDVSEMTEAELEAMPTITNDGINENGVIVSVNVVDAKGVDDMTGTAPGKEKLHASRVVRYLLDHAESAEHAISLLENVNIVGGFSGYALHWMIADKTDTYVAEIIHNRLTVSKNAQFFMTNFYLNYGSVQEEQVIAGTRFENLPLLNEYAIGVEHWCVLREAYDTITTAADMAKVLEAVKATAMYDRAKEPAWYTECTGGALSIHSSEEDFHQELERQIGWYETRDRTNPKGDWITWHSSIYDLANGTLLIYSQEDYSVCCSFSAPA